MASATFNHQGFDLRFDDTDVVNPGDLWLDWPLWLIHNEGFTAAVVFATCESDALNEAADAGKLDPWALSDDEVREYEADGNEESIDFLGNNGKPFDIESLGIVKLACPAISVAALVMAAKADQATARRAVAREEVKG